MTCSEVSGGVGCGEGPECVDCGGVGGGRGGPSVCWGGGVGSEGGGPSVEYASLPYKRERCYSLFQTRGVSRAEPNKYP